MSGVRKYMRCTRSMTFLELHKYSASKNPHICFCQSGSDLFEHGNKMDVCSPVRPEETRGPCPKITHISPFAN